jgi:hypothetical protein
MRLLVTVAEIQKFEFFRSLFLVTTVAIPMFCSYIFIFVLFLQEGRAGEAW